MDTLMGTLMGTLMEKLMEKIDKYRILKCLGEGGFSAVYLAHDDRGDRDVAIKLFRPRDEYHLIDFATSSFATSSSEDGLQVLRERFVREARILGGLSDSPYIINVYEFGETEEGYPYYVMPYVANHLGQLLGSDVFGRAVLDELDESAHPGALTLEQCLTLLHQILQGMEAAHAHGLVHRDIKPSNILLSNTGQVRVADFSIAKTPNGIQTTLGMGSRDYMAPEQQESARHVDGRADIYSIGVLAYRMLTGKLPTGRYADPEVVVPQLGKALNGMILKALQVDKDKRFRDAGEMLAAFEAALQQRTQEDEDEARFRDADETFVGFEAALQQKTQEDDAGSRKRRILPAAVALVAVFVAGLWFWAAEYRLYPVTITSNVTDARITLRGNGNDYSYRNGLQLPPGSYQVEVSAPEHVSQTRTVSLDSDQIIDFVLEQVLYPVTITSNVTDARITLRGNGNDYTYRNGLQLPAGSYQVSATAERYSPLSEIWQVSENNTRLVLELESIGPEPGGTFRDPLTDGGEGPLMVVLPAGRFRMGCLNDDDDCYDDEKPVHDVTLPNNFAMAVYEVSFAEYDRYVQATGVRRPDDEGWGRGNRPVINVDWEEARAYARWLSEQTGRNYRLPTEAEWEYAARAGTTTKYSWGNEATPEQANYHGNDRWENTAPVGSFPANGFGLYDMHGNVHEWTQDCWHRSYDGAPTNGQAWEGANGGDCDHRVVRGGSWLLTPGDLRAAYRNYGGVSDRGASLGLRLVQDLP